VLLICQVLLCYCAIYSWLSLDVQTWRYVDVAVIQIQLYYLVKQMCI
jgi:hypothetical protein